ncbi:MAG: M48 family metalloprotease [Bacteroidia bacterium]
MYCQKFKIWKSALLVCFIFSNGFLWAQNFEEDYKPLQNYNIRYKSTHLLPSIKHSFDSLLSAFSKEEKSNKKAISDAIKTLKEAVVMNDSMQYSMCADTLTSYFNSIVNRIKLNNPELNDHRITLFLNRTGIANASNYSAGVIYINLGLITGLSTESEIAFIICHEVAHDLIGHVAMGIKKKTDLLLNPKFKKKLAKLQKQEFNSYKETIELIKNEYAKFTEHSRENELQADSLGLLLYLNSNFPPYEAVNTILNLDSIDNPIYEDFIDIKAFFNFPGIKFDSSLLVNTDYVDLGEGNIKNIKIEDELKTHPDCIDRGIQLLTMLETKDTTAGLTYSNDRYLSAKNQAKFEIIEMLCRNEKYGFALYQSIQLLKQFPKNMYLKAMVVNCLFEIQEAQIKHTFSQVVDFTDKDYSSNYNNFLIFLHNLNSSKTTKFMEAYYNANFKKAPKNEFTTYVSYLVKSLEADDETNLSIPKKFKEQFPNSIYFKKLNDRFTKKLKRKK